MSKTVKSLKLGDTLYYVEDGGVIRTQEIRKLEIISTGEVKVGDWMTAKSSSKKVGEWFLDNEEAEKYSITIVEKEISKIIRDLEHLNQRLLNKQNTLQDLKCKYNVKDK